MNKNEYRPTTGRLQKVSCSSDYGKVKKYKVKHFNNMCTKNVPRHAQRIEDSLQAQKDAPYHHNDYNHLLRGKPIKQYKKDDIFETTKNKQNKKNTNKKQIKQSKIKTPILKYKDDFHYY